MRTAFLIFIIFIVTSCSNSYESLVRKGKDALLTNNYESAISYLEKALIEQPTSEDARILLLKAEEGKSAVDYRSRVERYIKENNALLEKYIKLKESLKKQEQNNEYTEEINDLKHDIELIKKKFDTDVKIAKAQSKFLEASKNLSSAISHFITMNKPEDVETKSESKLIRLKDLAPKFYKDNLFDSEKLFDEFIIELTKLKEEAHIT